MLLVKQKPAQPSGRAPINKPQASLWGIGVDLVSCSRIKQFLSRHREYVRQRFLNPSELRSFHRLTSQDFAEIFTAKEAFFKACGESWMGLEGFRGMRLKRREGDSFEMEWRPAKMTTQGASRKPIQGRSINSRKKLYRGEGFFFRSGDLVGAQAMIWR